MYSLSFLKAVPGIRRGKRLFCGFQHTHEICRLTGRDDGFSVDEKPYQRIDESAEIVLSDHVETGSSVFHLDGNLKRYAVVVRVHLDE